MSPVEVDCYYLNSEQKEFLLLNHERIEYNSFNYLCKTLYKTFGGFDSRNKYWRFSKQNYKALLKKAKDFSHIIKIVKIIKAKINVELYIHDEKHFSAHFSSSKGFQIEKFIEIITKRNIKFKQENGLLIFDLNSYDLFMKKVIAKFENCSLISLPKGVLELFKNKCAGMDYVDMDYIEKSIDSSIFNQLKDFQKIAVLHAIQNNAKLFQLIQQKQNYCAEKSNRK